MIAVIQRVSQASVAIDKKIHAAISAGLVILVGIAENDTEIDAEWICNKILSLRIFSDKEEKMNLSLMDIDGEILLISQFTLLANTTKGNRPSYILAAKPSIAIPLYKYCIEKLKNILGDKLKTGEFGADMQVSLINDGPVTIVLNSKEK